MTSLSLKIPPSQLTELLKLLQNYDIQDLVIEDEPTFESNQSIVRESFEKYASGADKTFSIEEADAIIERVIR